MCDFEISVKGYNLFYDIIRNEFQHINTWLVFRKLEIYITTVESK